MKSLLLALALALTVTALHAAPLEGNTITANGTYTISTYVGKRYVFAVSGGFGGGSLAFNWNNGSSTAYAGSPVTTAATFAFTAAASVAEFVLSGATGANLTVAVALADSKGAGDSVIADGALTIAKTNGLQTALDGKAKQDQLVPTPLAIVDDRGGYSITHTSPLYIPGGFGGYTYWMAYTPYPGANEENPRVMASNDGVNWVLPAGMAPLIDTLANAQALGHIGWSDTDLAWDGAKLWLVYRGYGNGTTYTAAETLYLRQCTDGVNWSSRSSIITAPTSTSAKILSPSLVQMADNTWRIYVIDNGGGGMHYYTSSNGTTGWAYAAQCGLPFGTSYWHLAVKLYGGVYYALLNSRRGWSLYAYSSLDGVKFTGRGVPFVARTDAAMESGGQYRSGFYLSGANPPTLNIYAVGMTGSTEDANNANKTHRCYIYRKAFEGLQEVTSPWEWDVIQLVDYFVGGQDASTSDAIIGDLRWSLYNGVGAGSAVPGGANKVGVFDDLSMPGLSCVAIKSGALAGNITGLQFDHDTAAGGGRFPWNFLMLRTMQNPTFRVTFKIESLSDSIWIGLGSANLLASPTRYTGLQFTPASANFRFVSREAGGSAYDVDSAKPATAGMGKWWRFEMQWTGTNWRMRLTDVNAYQAGNDWVTVTSAINDASGINFSMWTMSGGAVASELRVCKWAFRGFTGRY